MRLASSCQVYVAKLDQSGRIGHVARRTATRAARRYLESLVFGGELVGEGLRRCQKPHLIPFGLASLRETSSSSGKCPCAKWDIAIITFSRA